MPSTPTSAAQILLAAAAAAAETSTVSTALAAGTVQTWRTKDRQPKVRPDGLSRGVDVKPFYLFIKAAKREGDPKDKHKEIRSYQQGYGRSWATAEAAEADRANFKL